MLTVWRMLDFMSVRWFCCLLGDLSSNRKMNPFKCNIFSIAAKKTYRPDEQQLVMATVRRPLWQPYRRNETWPSAAIRFHKAGAHAWRIEAQQSHSWRATSGPPDRGGPPGIRGWLTPTDSHMQNLMIPSKSRLPTYLQLRRAVVSPAVDTSPCEAL